LYWGIIILDSSEAVVGVAAGIGVEDALGRFAFLPGRARAAVDKLRSQNERCMLI